MMAEERRAHEHPVRWWHVRARLNGKFWVLVAFLVAAVIVSAATLYRSWRIGDTITLSQLAEWRRETTATWHTTLEQMDRLEANQRLMKGTLRALTKGRRIPLTGAQPRRGDTTPPFTLWGAH